MNKTAYLLIRLSIALSMFGHGLVRMPKLAAFSAWMVGNFEKSMLPKALVVPFSYLLPVAELLVGILLLIGLFTRFAAIAGGVVMLALIFGSTMTENWEALPSQLIHVAFFAVVLQFVESNSWALDKGMKS